MLLEVGEADLPRQSVIDVSKVSAVHTSQLGACIGALSAAATPSPRARSAHRGQRAVLFGDEQFGVHYLVGGGRGGGAGRSGRGSLVCHEDKKVTSRNECSRGSTAGLRCAEIPKAQNFRDGPGLGGPVAGAARNGLRLAAPRAVAALNGPWRGVTLPVAALNSRWHLAPGAPAALNSSQLKVTRAVENFSGGWPGRLSSPHAWVVPGQRLPLKRRTPG